MPADIAIFKHNRLNLADNCIVYRHNIISNSDDTNLLQQDINSIAEWASLWQMKFNVTKCCCIHFSSSQTGYFSNTYMLYNTLLPCSNHCKYLGVTLQSDLKWDQHIKEKIANANSTLGLLRRNIKVSSAHIKELS